MHQSARPTFTFLGHATVRCELPDGRVILIDPWIEGNPSCTTDLDSLGRVDAILITHGHADHMADAVAVAERYRPEIVVATYEICAWLTGKGVEGCSGMNPGGTQDVLGCRVTQVPAIHTSSIEDGDRMIYGGIATGFVVTGPSGFTFYHAGDTCVFTDMQLIADLYRPYLAFLPIGDHFTMGPRQAALACKLLEIREAVPVHWGTFPLLTGTPERFEEELGREGVNCKVVTLQPGESY
ncbi:MAG: metal-dependent hydrolase [Acidobacteriota bacterium]